MKKGLILIGVLILTMVLTIFCAALAALSTSKEHSILIFTILCTMFITVLLIHWLATGRCRFLEWFGERKANIICIYGVFYLSLFAGVLFGNVFYVALFLLIPLIIAGGAADHYIERSRLSMYYNEDDYDESTQYFSKYKCLRCGGETTMIVYKNPMGRKKTEYQCDCCGQVYKKEELKK